MLVLLVFLWIYIYVTLHFREASGCQWPCVLRQSQKQNHPVGRSKNSGVCDMLLFLEGARCSSVVRAFAHGAMGRWIDPSWGGPIELFLVPASAPRLV